MSNYNQLVDFAVKDTLPDNSPQKVVRGGELNNEFNAISQAVSTKADKLFNPIEGSLLTASGDGNIIQSPRTLPSIVTASRVPNAIMNPLFNIWQRGTSIPVQVTETSTADRWKVLQNGITGAVTVSKSNDVPTVAQAGRVIQASAKIEVTTLQASIPSNGYCIFVQKIEGFRFAPMAQRPTVLSFWVKAPAAGQYGVYFTNADNTRTYITTMDINLANAWERKELQIPASPSDGVWQYGSGLGIQLGFVLACGSARFGSVGSWGSTSAVTSSNQVNMLTNVGAMFITGFQWELGTSATELEAVDYHLDFAGCQRFFETSCSDGVAPVSGNNNIAGMCVFTLTQANNLQQGYTVRYAVAKRPSPAPSIRILNPIVANNQVRNFTQNMDWNTCVAINYGTAGFEMRGNTSLGSIVGASCGFHFTSDYEL